MALFFLGTIGSSILVHAVPYTPETLPLKIGAFTLFSSIMGVTMAPLIAIAGIYITDGNLPYSCIIHELNKKLNRDLMKETQSSG